MVTRRTIILVCLLLLSFTLAGCEFLGDIFSLSPFPGYLSQAVASVDLTDKVNAFVGGGDMSWQSQLYVLRRVSDGKDFVFLIIQKDFGGQRVYAFDDSLDLRSYGTVDHRNEIHLVEAASSNFVVGDVRFDSLTLSASEAGLPDVWGHGFSNGTNNYLLRDEGTQLRCPSWDSAWGTLSDPYYDIEDLGSGYVNYRLVAVRYDPFLPDVELLDFPVYLVFYNWEEEYVRMVKTPVSEYAGGLSSVPLISATTTYPYSPKVYEIRDKFFCYTRRGVVASSRRDGVFYRISFEGEKLDSFRVSKEEHPVMDFDLDGEYYYYFDELNTRLYKAVTGW